MYVVYRLLFPNGKSYIGITKSFKKRMQAHKSKNSRKSHFLIKRAIQKYGFSNIKIFYISKYNSLTKGYNMTPGGEGILGYKHSKESKNKIGQASKKRVRRKRETI